MTDAQRRYMHARERLTRSLILPAQELLDATSALVQAEKERADSAEQTLESARPFWAQGFSTESIAAQTLSAALGQIYELIGTTDQTSTMETLRMYFKERTNR